MRGRFGTFFIVASLVLWLLYAFTSLRLGGGTVMWVILALPFMLVWLLPVLYWSAGRREAAQLDRVFQWASFLSMGFLSYLLVATLARDGLGLATGWFALPGHVILAALLLTAISIGIAYGGPWVKEVEITVDGLAAGLDGLRIAQISDLHVGPTIRKRYVQRVVAKTNALQPDIVALTGDMVDGSIAALGTHVAPLAGLRPRGRVYYVPGNHEYYWDVDAWIQEFGDLGATILLNRGELIDHQGASLFIGGITDPTANMRRQPGPDVAAAAVGGDTAAFRLLLAHQPQAAAEAAAQGFNLQLSGHTHAGQFFPWTLVVRFFHTHFSGLSRSGKLWVYVSQGTGSWGPPLRLGTIPEITLIKLRRPS